MLRRIALFALAFGFAAPVIAGTQFDTCGLASDWSVKLQATDLSFTRENDRAPARIVLSGGELTVDGHPITLTAADRDRLRAYEAEVRELIPEAKAIALDAIAIAFTAVDEVARMFAGKDEASYTKTAEQLATARILARRQVEEAFDGRGWSDAEVERLVEEAVTQLLPALIGDIVGTAVQVALSGDEQAAAELEARAKRMEKEIERRVEGRAKLLEARAEALCPRLVALDQMEAKVAAELAPGQRFDLIRVDH